MKNIVSFFVVMFAWVLVGNSQPCNTVTSFNERIDLACNSTGQASIDVSSISCVSEVSFNWLLGENQPLCSFADGPDTDDLFGDAMCTSVDHLPTIVVVVEENAEVTVSVEIMSPQLLRFVQPPLDNQRVQRIQWYINGAYQGKVTLGDNWATAHHLSATFTQAGRYEITFSVDPNDIESTGVMAAVDWADLRITGTCGSDEDTEHPFILCPADTLVMCPDDIPSIDINSVIAYDNCDNDVEVYHLYDISDGQTCPLTIKRYYRAVDDAGNSTSCIQTITVWDTIPPVMVCPTDLDLGCDQNTDPDHTGWPTAIDNCVGDILFYWRDSIVDEGSGHYTLYREWQAQDEPDKDCCNYSYCTQIITYQVDGFSQTSPLQKNSSGVKTLVDACMETSFHWTFPKVNQHSSGEAIGVYNEFPATITIEGTDDLQDGVVSIELWSEDTLASYTNPTYANNRADSISYLINGIQSEKIAIPIGYANRLVLSWEVLGGDKIEFIPSDIIDQGGPLSLTYFTNLTQSGSCGGCDTDIPLIIDCPVDITVSCEHGTDPISVGQPSVSPVDAVVTYTDSSQSGECPLVEIITRTWQAIYDGDTLVCKQHISVKDIVPPTVQYIEDISLSCGATVPEVNIQDLTIKDNCHYEVAWLGDEAIGNTIIRKYEVSDDCNTIVAIQTYTLADTPITIACPDDITIGSESELPTPDPTLITVLTGESVTTFYDGQSTIIDGCQIILERSYSASNACDTVRCVQYITIENSAALAINEWPDDITLECHELYPPWYIVFDECGDPIQVTIYELTDSSTDCEQQQEFYAFLTDSQGRRSDTVNWTVTVVDTESPVLTDIPPDITVDSLDIDALGDYQIVATDNCSDELTLATKVTVLDDSTLVRVFEAVDHCGNSALDSQYIHIVTTIDSTDTENPDGLALCEFYAYPNPTVDGLFTVRFGPSELLGDQAVLEIWTIHGMLLTTTREINPREANQIPVNISGLKTGIYLCKIIVPGMGQRICRVVKTN